ncbi:MAG: DUF2807 domain-containing protein [Chitinophagaceae bacterium]|nr:DUF2807 domain-containing protein [Chitinophagaceae bacterium]
MKAWIWALWLSFLVMFTQAQEGKVINDPNVEKRTVDAFHSVEVSGSIELIVTQSAEMAVAISAAKAEDIPKIITETRGGVLHIHIKDGEDNWWKSNWNTMGRKFRAYVSAPEFQAISNAGSGSIRILGTLKAEDLELSSAGSGNIEGRLEADKVEIVQSGSGNVRLQGKIAHANVRCSGSGNFRSETLEMEYGDVSMSGSGNAEFTVNKELTASVSGSGNIRFRGNGLIRDMHVSGSGKIRRVDSPQAASL